MKDLPIKDVSRVLLVSSKVTYILVQCSDGCFSLTSVIQFSIGYVGHGEPYTTIPAQESMQDH